MFPLDPILLKAHNSRPNQPRLLKRRRLSLYHVGGYGDVTRLLMFGDTTAE